MKAYDWLLFDLDNTILDFGASSQISFYKMMSEKGFEMASSDYARFKQINIVVWKEMESGRINHQELKAKRWQIFFDEKKIDLDPLDANDNYFEHIKENPVFVRFAEEVLLECSANFRQMIITNGLAEVQWPRIRKTGLNAFFEHIVISEELGHSKPNSAYFQHCHQLMEYPDKNRVLVIGDTLNSDIVGGKAFGYNTCWFNIENIENLEVEADFEIKDLRELSRLLLP